jgi:general secretion pathway protein F
MAVFKYIAVDNNGKEETGIMEADSLSQIRQMLRQQSLIPIEIEASTQEKAKSKYSSSLFQRSINSTDLTIVTYQFATLMSAGLPIEESLLNTAEQFDKPHVKSILYGVHAKVLEGHSLAASLDEYPSSFPQLYRASVAAGEKSGELAGVLDRLAIYMEKQRDVQQKVQQALIYPGLLTLVSIGIVVFLLSYVVPKIVTIFIDSGQGLPLMTRALLSISDFVQNYGIYVAIILFVAAVAFRQALKQDRFRAAVHHLLLKIPIVGKTINDVNTARFSRTFGILFAASVPVLEAMHAACSVVKMLPMKYAIEKNIKKVSEGTAIHKALQETGYFSLLTVRLIASGEMSGRLEQMLEKSADYQDRMVSKKIDIALALFEPTMIMVMGGIVLFIVLAVLLPIFELNQLVT